MLSVFSLTRRGHLVLASGLGEGPSSVQQAPHRLRQLCRAPHQAHSGDRLIGAPASVYLFCLTVPRPSPLFPGLSFRIKPPANQHRLHLLVESASRQHMEVRTSVPHQACQSPVTSVEGRDLESTRAPLLQERGCQRVGGVLAAPVPWSPAPAPWSGVDPAAPRAVRLCSLSRFTMTLVPPAAASCLGIVGPRQARG